MDWTDLRCLGINYYINRIFILLPLWWTLSSLAYTGWRQNETLSQTECKQKEQGKAICQLCHAKTGLGTKVGSASQAMGLESKFPNLYFSFGLWTRLSIGSIVIVVSSNAKRDHFTYSSKGRKPAISWRNRQDVSTVYSWIVSHKR